MWQYLVVGKTVIFKEKHVKEYTDTHTISSFSIDDCSKDYFCKLMMLAIHLAVHIFLPKVAHHCTFFPLLLKDSLFAFYWWLTEHISLSISIIDNSHRIFLYSNSKISNPNPDVRRLLPTHRLFLGQLRFYLNYEIN